MDYKDGDRVGRGGFAVVDAVDTDDYGLVAKKTLEPIQQILEEVGIDHLTKRFDREVRYQSELTHPNVVQILSFNLAAVPPYFYMPLAECSLKDELENGELSADEIRRALFDILNGLEHIHAQGYIHRDLKPGNVLKLQNQDKSYRYALSDFGLISATNSDTTTLTGSNAHGGSRNYSAPELLGGFGRATSAADIYSFGAILHDFFAPGMRRIPYAELSAPGDIGAVISKCTKTNTVRRYSAIAGLRDDLFNAIEGEQQEFATAREEELINLLEEDRELTDEEWDAVFIQMDDNKQAGDSNVNYFRAIGKARIEELQRDAPDLFNAMGLEFAEYCQVGTFNFDYCDVLVNKLVMFYDGANIELKSKIAIATLVLGVSHNRWHVEYKFAYMASSEISDELAKRICVEAKVQSVDFFDLLGRWSRSINASVAGLHVEIQQHYAGSS